MVEINALSTSLIIKGIARHLDRGPVSSVQPESPQSKTPMSRVHRMREQLGNAYLKVNFVQGAHCTCAQFPPITH